MYRFKHLQNLPEFFNGYFIKNNEVHHYNTRNTIPMLCQLSYAVEPTRTDRVAQLAEHWASIPKVVDSIPTVARHIFQACPFWVYTQSNITQASYSPEYITPTQQIS